MRSPHADAGLRLRRVAYGDPDAVRLVADVQAEYVERYGSPDDSPLDPVMFDPPRGSFFVGYLDDEPVATGAWRASAVPVAGAARTAEIKRMYVVPQARGRGLAREVLAHLERTAAAAGYDALVLETGLRQPEAIALYETSGYQRVPGFGHYRDSPLSRCFARVLDDPRAPLVDALGRLHRALAARDVGGAVDCFVPQGALFGDGPGEDAHGHDELERTFTAVVGRGIGAEWELADTWAHREGDHVSFVADATVVVVVLGRRSRRRRLRLSGALRRTDGLWRFELFNGLDPVLGAGLRVEG